MESTGQDAAYEHDIQVEYKRGAEEALRRAFELAKKYDHNSVRGILIAAEEFEVRL